MDTPGHLQDLLATLKLAEIAVDARPLTTDPSVQALGCALFVHEVKRNFYGSCGGSFHARDVHQAQRGHSNISLHNDNPSRISPVVPRAICHEAVSALLASAQPAFFPRDACSAPALQALVLSLQTTHGARAGRRSARWRY